MDLGVYIVCTWVLLTLNISGLVFGHLEPFSQNWTLNRKRFFVGGAKQTKTWASEACAITPKMPIKGKCDCGIIEIGGYIRVAG